MDNRWLCLKSFLVNTQVADFFIDTNPFVDKYFSDLDFALRNSSAKWKVVVGHHTIRSIGHHGDTKEVVDQILPILEVTSYAAMHERERERDMLSNMFRPLA
ncbi:hypothetical protein ACFX2F_016071 [Malus domestica]